MPRQAGKIPPAYCLYKPKNLAYVAFDGHPIYLGPHGSPESKRRYARLIAEWAANDGRSPRNIEGSTVVDLFAAFWSFAQGWYVKNGRATTELYAYRSIGTILLELYADLPISRFGPRQLKACRHVMISRGWSRRSINRQVCRIRRIFRWGVGEEMVSDEQLGRLRAVEGLRRGRCDARESEPVGTVPQAHIRAIRDELPPVVWAMIQVQQLTGMRSGELVAMKGALIDRTGEIWLYRPTTHKTAHHGHERLIALGPRAQVILRSLIFRRRPDEYLFRPADSWDWHRTRRHAARRVPLNQGNRPGRSNRPRVGLRKITDRFTPATYRRAIARACKKVGVPHWHPHQLRHNAATRIRRDYDLEAARTVLGQQSLNVTDIYAARDAALARRVMMEVG